jgi:hypothetical protein
MQIVSFLKFYTAYADSKSQSCSPENSKPTVLRANALSGARVDSLIGSTSGNTDQKIASST